MTEQTGLQAPAPAEGFTRLAPQTGAGSCCGLARCSR